MIDTVNFIVRLSGRHADRYYIDYVGAYRAVDISRLTKVGEETLEGIYRANGGLHDDAQDVYYFLSEIEAQKTISDIFARMEKRNKGRVVTLAEAEIEYIRMALINDGSGFAGVNNKLKDAIFKKLNG